MYLTHFGLQEKPFKSSPDPKYLWLGTGQKKALDALVSGILHGDGIGIVTGDLGTGKTTLANAVWRELGIGSSPLWFPARSMKASIFSN